MAIAVVGQAGYLHYNEQQQNGTIPTGTKEGWLKDNTDTLKTENALTKSYPEQTSTTMIKGVPTS